ncbi:MAG TPA: hypothetical protein VGF59_26480 [Bryobacteraceae bacterium]|jgi:hypothetical protein
MAQLHLTEAELARDLHGILEKVREGAEVVVERGSEPLAVIKPPQFHGRPIAECIAWLEAHGSHATLDDQFGRDLEAVIDDHREALKPPTWD